MIDDSISDDYGTKMNRIDLNRIKIEVENGTRKEEESMERSLYLKKKLPILQNKLNYTQDALAHALNTLNDKIKTTTDKIGNSEALSIIEQEIIRYNLQNKKPNNGSIDSKVTESSYIGQKFSEINGNKNGGGIKYSEDIFKYVVGELNGKATYYLKDKLKVTKAVEFLKDQKFKTKEEALDLFTNYIDYLRSIEEDNKDESIKIKSIYKEKSSKELINEVDKFLKEYNISKKKGIQKIISEEEINQARINEIKSITNNLINNKK